MEEVPEAPYISLRLKVKEGKISCKFIMDSGFSLLYSINLNKNVLKDSLTFADAVGSFPILFIKLVLASERGEIIEKFLGGTRCGKRNLVSIAFTIVLILIISIFCKSSLGSGGVIGAAAGAEAGAEAGKDSKNFI